MSVLGLKISGLPYLNSLQPGDMFLAIRGDQSYKIYGDRFASTEQFTIAVEDYNLKIRTVQQNLDNAAQSLNTRVTNVSSAADYNFFLKTHGIKLSSDVNSLSAYTVFQVEQIKINYATLNYVNTTVNTVSSNLSTKIDTVSANLKTDINNLATWTDTNFLTKLSAQATYIPFPLPHEANSNGNLLTWNTSTSKWISGPGLDSVRNNLDMGPIGSVIAYAGSTPPAGYLECNGQKVLKSQYPELWAALGNAYEISSPVVVSTDITIGLVTTFAGLAGTTGSDDGNRTAAKFFSPQRTATDSNRNVYVTDTYNNTIRKISSSGTVTTFAGTAGAPGNVNGTGSAARFNAPAGIAIDSSNNVFVSDSLNHAIRKITPAGVVTTFATGFNNPTGLAIDGSNNLFVCDNDNSVIKKVTSSGTVTVFAGTLGSTGKVDGTGTSAKFANPEGIAIDLTSGNIYVADTYNHTIRKITPSGVVTTFAGTAESQGSADGTGAAARFSRPHGITIDSNGIMYIADTHNQAIRKITSSGVVTTIAGSKGISGSADGVGTNARFSFPIGITIDSFGDMYVADSSNSTIRKITTGTVEEPSGDANLYFKVPDLRGEFIRGWDHNRGVDSGRNLGSTQTPGVGQHVHDFYDIYAIWGDNIGNYRITNGVPVLDGPMPPVAGNSGFRDADGNFHKQYFYYSNAYDGDNDGGAYAIKNRTLAAIGDQIGETRPRNIALMYCIKAQILVATTSINDALVNYLRVPTTPSTGQYLKYNGTSWVPSSLPPIPTLPSQQLPSTATTGALLKWDGSNWVAGPSKMQNVITHSSVTLSNNSSCVFTDIPNTASKITLVIAGLNITENSGQSVKLQLGTSTGYVIANYSNSSTGMHANPSNRNAFYSYVGSTQSLTDGCYLLTRIVNPSFLSTVTGPSDYSGLTTIITFMRANLNTINNSSRWVYTYNGCVDISPIQGAGNVYLNEPVPISIRLLPPNPSSLLTTGNITLYWE